MIVYIVTYDDRDYDGGDSITVGVYSSYDLADAAIKKKYPEAVKKVYKYKDAAEIPMYEIDDGHSDWAAITIEAWEVDNDNGKMALSN